MSFKEEEKIILKDTLGTNSSVKSPSFTLRPALKKGRKMLRVNPESNYRVIPPGELVHLVTESARLKKERT